VSSGPQEDEMTQTPEDAGPGPAPSRLAPVRTGVVAALVFVVGLALGAVVAGFLAADPVVVRAADGPVAGDAATGPSLPAEDAAAQFVVSGACLSAVNAAQDTLLLVDDIGRGAAELDAAALDETVRRLMPLQTRLQSGLEACRVATEVTGGGTGTEDPGDPSGSPAPSPSD
jgi:hypothetical protein